MPNHGNFKVKLMQYIAIPMNCQTNHKHPKFRFVWPKGYVNLAKNSDFPRTNQKGIYKGEGGWRAGLEGGRV